MSSPAAERDTVPARLSAPTDPAVRSAMLRFSLLSAVAALTLTVLTLGLADQIARGMAVDDARTQGMNVLKRIAAPLVDEAVRAGDPGAAAALTMVMANRMSDGSVSSASLLDDTGRVIWSDDPEEIGDVQPLDPEVVALLGTDEAIADLSAAHRPGSGGEGGQLQVFAGGRDADGVPLVLEAHLPTASMDANARAIVVAFVPLIVGSLLVLLVLVLPLALSLGRRIDRAQSEKATLMRHAALASELERRRLAEDLHHGLVQDLAGLGYAMPALRHQVGPDGDPEAAGALVDRMTAVLQDSVLAVRTLMTDIYPPDLERHGLAAAVGDLVFAESTRAGLEPDVDVDDDLRLPPDAERLAYRVVREGVRNVVKHAGARHVLVEVRVAGSSVVVRVVDDGVGPGPAPGESPPGHLGLRLLADTTSDLGGTFSLSEREGGGTVLETRFPVPALS